MNIKRISYLFGILIFLNGCAGASSYTRPEAAVPSRFPTDSAYGDPAASLGAGTPDQLGWQGVFFDERLRQVIAMALRQNQDLRLAALNVERARAYYGVQRAELLPSVAVSGMGSKQRVPGDISGTGSSVVAEQYSVDLGIASWEIDLFGRIRRLKEKALQEYLATEQVRRGAQTALVSEVARVYYTLAADRQNLNLARSTFDAQERRHQMIRKQYDLGVATELDLSRSQAQMDAARGDVARYAQLTALDQNALDLLAGGTVPQELLPLDLQSVASPADISVGISSEVLLHRPDIMAAEHQLLAARALIGAARSAFFPRISLTTAIGSASTALSGLFDGGSDTWSFVPRLSIPVFDARVWTAFRVSKATQEIALAQYQKAIQGAFREVADALAVRGTIDEQVSAQEAVVASAQRVYELSDKRYSEGLDGYLGVLDAQRSLYAAQQGLTSLHLARRANQVRFFAVLGGDL